MRPPTAPLASSLCFPWCLLAWLVILSLQASCFSHAFTDQPTLYHHHHRAGLPLRQSIHHGKQSGAALLDRKVGDINGRKSRCVLCGAAESSDNDQQLLCSRRDSLQRVGGTAAAAVLLLSQPANAAQTTGEAIRRTASSIPGYGQPDVYYPSSYLGRWSASRTIVVSDDPYLANLVPITITHEVRFVPVDGHVGGADSKVVADRAFNEKSYYEAMRSAVLDASPGADANEVPPQLRSTVWDASNPNVLTQSYVDGTSREIEVTKRAATLGQDGEGTVSCSEYRRVSDVGKSGIPSLSASRAKSKWRTVLNEQKGDIMEGIEVVYAEGVMGDPMGGGSPGGAGAGGALTVSSKSRVRLERI